MEKEELNIIEHILDGNNRQYAILMDRYSQQVFNLIFQMAGNQEDAEELTQDTFLKAYQNLKRFKGESSFSTWIYRIAYNTTISAMRKKKYTCYVDEQQLTLLSDNQVNALLDSDTEENCENLRKAINKLDTKERALITMFYEEEKSIKEICEIITETESNIKVKLHRIRYKLYLLIKGKKDETCKR